HWSWFETAVRAPQSNHPNREDEIAGILFRRQHLSLHRSGSASRRLADGQNRPCPSAGKGGADRQPALRAVPTLIPLRWTGRTSPPGGRSIRPAKFAGVRIVPKRLDLFEFLLALLELVTRLKLQRENPFGSDGV